MLTTLPKAAKACGIPYSTLLRLVHEKKVPVVEVPGRRSFLIDADDLQVTLDGWKRGAVPGTVEPEEPAQVAPNQQSRKAYKVGPKATPYEWCQ